MKIEGKVQQYRYTVIYRSNSKRMVLRYDVHGSLQVSAPYGVPRVEVERFIIRSIPKLEKWKKPEASWKEGRVLYVSGTSLLLAFSENAKTPFVDGFKLYVLPGTEEQVVEQIKTFFHSELERRLPPLLAHWCEILGVTIKGVTIRNTHRVWASCSYHGCLNFSLRCAGLGDDDLSYLVLHELDHRINFNHGESFHLLLDKHMPSWRERDQHLKAMQRRCDIFGGR